MNFSKRCQNYLVCILVNSLSWRLFLFIHIFFGLPCIDWPPVGMVSTYSLELIFSVEDSFSKVVLKKGFYDVFRVSHWIFCDDSLTNNIFVLEKVKCCNLLLACFKQHFFIACSWFWMQQLDVLLVSAITIFYVHTVFFVSLLQNERFTLLFLRSRKRQLAGLVWVRRQVCKVPRS